MRVRLVELVLEPLLSEQRTVQPEQRILEDKVLMPVRSRLVLSEHMLERTSRQEQHSLV